VDPATGLELPSPYTTSDGKAKVRGAEAEIVWAARDNLRFNFSAGWLDTRYTDIGDPDVSSLAFGAPFADAPEWSFTEGLQYDVPLRNGARITLREDYGWKSEYQRDPSVARQTVEPEPAYGLLNLRAMYTPPGGEWTFTAFGSNLTNERYVDGGFVSAGLGLDLITVGPPRELGVSIAVNFQ
jgi:iron complex outermembrane receptor protein